MPKILCLTSQNLDGPAQGAVLRAQNVFNLLSRLGDVRLVLAGYHVTWDKPGPACGGFELLRAIRFEPTRNVSFSDRLQHELNPRFMNTDWLQARKEDREWLLEAIAQHDLVWVHGIHVANGFGIWRWQNGVMDIDDIPSSVERSKLRQAQGFKHALAHQRQIFLWERHERTLWERFNAVCVCSEPDRKLMAQPEKTFVVSNGFAKPENVTRRPAHPPHLGFVGNFAFPPNVEGMRWFVREVWPLILKQFPQARLRVAGDRSELENWPANQNIDALGWLKDVSAEMAGWSLSVVPILSGGGTRVKIAEAFGHRCPMVSTSLGAYGYDVKDGQELFLADNAADFAAKCIRLLNEPLTGEQLAARAREKFEANWTWEAQAGRVAAVVNSVTGTTQTK